VLESEKESRVSESDVLDGVGEGAAERCRAIFCAWMVGGFLPLRFMPIVRVGIPFWKGDAVAI